MSDPRAQRCMFSPNATGDYQITYSENFGSYNVGQPFFQNNPNWKKILTPDPYDDPTVQAIPPQKIGSAGHLLRIEVNSTPPAGHVSGILSTVSRVPPNLGKSGIGPSGRSEHSRWAIIAEFYPHRAALTAGEHIGIFLRVLEQADVDNQTRFGVAIQPPGGGNGCPTGSDKEAFLQFTGFNKFTNQLDGFTECFPQALTESIDWNDPNQRYSMTFEEWFQDDGAFGFRLHWLGSIYKVTVDPVTLQFTYTCLGSMEYNASVGVREVVKSDGTKTILVPPLTDSKIAWGSVFFTIGVDADPFYVAEWVY